MKPVHIIIGGTYFLEPRVKFFDNEVFRQNNDVIVDRVDWEQVYNKKSVEPKADIGFIFGIKQWTRKMKKKRMSPKDIVARICRFVDKTFGTKMPIGLLNDLELRSGSSLTGRLSKELFKQFNCQFILLREYIKGKDYDKRIHPFAISSVSRLHLAKDVMFKSIDLYFRGDDSSDDRKDVIRAAERIKDIEKSLKVYKGGERSKEKIPEDQFFKEMTDAKICLNVMGNGYSCYRYQEIPSVGSILATKNYPLVVENDYIDMHSCIKFEHGFDLKDKIHKILSSKQQAKDMTEECKNWFLKYHTTEKRFEKFIFYLERLK